MKYQKFKKSVLWINLVILLISIISFVILLDFFNNTNYYLVSSSEDLKCRTFLSGKDITFVNFLFNLNYYCKKDTIIIDDEEKEKVFDKLALLGQKCSFRYGSGEFNFLKDFDIEGSSWCFTCAKFSFKGGNPTTSYDYNNDFYNYLKNKELKNFGVEKQNYLDKVNLIFYKKFELDEISFSDTLIDSFYLSEENKKKYSENKLQNILYEYNNRLREFQVYENKKIDRDKNYYVVYRYIVTDNEDLMNEVEKNELVYNSKYGTSVLLLNQNFRSIIIKSSKFIVKSGKSFFFKIPGLNIIGAGFLLNSAINKDSIQYVNIMDEDEYNRKCGIEPYVLKRRDLN
jgi:hypothetical protein